MGRTQKQPDPLRAKSSRVEKPRPAKKDTRDLPSWYFRVLAFSYKGDKDVLPRDFDEDISELEEEDDDSKQGEEKEKLENDCECGGDDPECDCQFLSDSDVDEDGESERSYNGSDADYYYELKEEREERKRELLREQKERKEQRDMEKAKEAEVRAVFKSVKRAKKKAERPLVDSLAGQVFWLFCADYVDHFYSDLHPTKRVEFRLPDDDDKPFPEDPELGTGSGMVIGQVYLNTYACFDFGPFCAPKRASRKAVKVKCHDGADGAAELSLKFLGNGYLKLRVPRDLVFLGHHYANPITPPPKTPDVFKFVGIWDDPEEVVERAATLSDRPSPHETWFEMNHPMGSWKQSWLQ
ncbi:uncharacterized protein C8A04DRAFT_40907 [Dichotomopilus funicola]|uniref:Uncharacterized protein n=1 Tax=Dichotomopilus funicola TaxID=1934379 RepID=A0AAN6UU26_9PEZI|nr:hypothetical protein C8A04DRAFT_40907 [Dichotomopilus funicola]